MARKGHGRPASLVQVAGSGTTYPDDGTSPVGSNEWNANRDITGVHGFTKKTEAISSYNINITDSYVEVTNAGEIRTMSQVTTALSTDYYASDTSTKSFAEGDLLYLVKATAGHTITLKHQNGGAGAGKITTLTGGDLLLSTTVPRIFMCRTIGSYQEWVEYGGGSASDLDTTNFTAAAIVTESDAIGSNDNDTTLPTSAAVKDYVDTQVATEDTIAELNDTTITGPANLDLLQWNGSAWVDRTYAEAGVQGTVTFGIADGAVAKCNDVVVDDDFLRINGTEIEGRSAAEVLADIGAVSATLADGNFLVGNNSNVATSVNPSGDIDITNAGVFSITADSVINADVKTDAAIAFSMLAALTSGNLVVGSSGNVATSVNPSGDIDVSNAGVFSIASDVIINADVKTDAAIAYSKLAALTSTQILVGNGSNVATSVAVTGDVTISNAGVTAIGINKINGTHIAMTSDAQGDILYYDGTNYVRLGYGTSGHFLKTQGTGANPVWASAGGGATLLHSYSNNTQMTVFTVSGQSVAYDAGTAVGTQAAGVGTRDVYIRKIDTNNEGVFALVHKNGAIVEVQVA